jgi:cell division septation protein DedD
MSYQFDPAELDRQEGLFGDRRQVLPRRRLLAVAAALLVMVMFAGGLWLAYVAGTRHAAGGAASEVPLIRADPRPMMVRPAEPGGLKIPDRNMLIYDPGKQMVEHLLPPPEQPMVRPTAAAASAGAPAMSAPAAPPTATAAAPTATAAAPTPPAAAHGASPAKTGNVRLQLGSVRSAGTARAEWDRIRQRNSDLLGALSASPVRADLGDKGIYYRIETGPIGSAAADRLCGALKARKVGCVIVR